MSSNWKTPIQDSSSRYVAAAEAALCHYSLGLTHLHFISHNAGVVFRIEAPEHGHAFLLKLHVRVGEGPNASAARLEMGMQWLAGIAHDTNITVQTPIATTAGAFVGTVVFEQKPIHCTVQQWLDGEFSNGPFTENQMRRIGMMMAQLHRYSRHSTLELNSATQHGPEALSEHLLILRDSLDRAIFPSTSYEIARNALHKVQAIMEQLGKTQDVWGPVHGDLHYDNIILSEGDVHPIDFSELRAAHYLYDIGVTLYHTFHQGYSARQAFLQGYREVEPLSREHLKYLEAFVTYAALDNLSWNATIPEQVVSPLFLKNLQQFVFTFCRSVTEDISFLTIQAYQARMRPVPFSRQQKRKNNTEGS